MAIGCGAKCAKILLIVFNFVFWLSGAAILGIGIWLRVDPKILEITEVINITRNEQFLEIASYVLIGIGCFVFIVGFFGCCGAIKESKCMLGLYMFFLVLVMGGEIAAGALVIIYKGEVDRELLSSMTKQVKNNYSLKNESALTQAWNYAQIEFKCCGANNATDYKDSQWKKESSDTVPVTCCVLEKTDIDDPQAKDKQKCQNDANKKQDNTKNFYFKGCYEEIMTWFKTHSMILIAVACGIAGIEIFGLVFAICLCRNIGQEV